MYANEKDFWWSEDDSPEAPQAERKKQAVLIDIFGGLTASRLAMMLAEVEQIYPMSKLVDETIQEHRKTQKKDPKK